MVPSSSEHLEKPIRRLGKTWGKEFTSFAFTHFSKSIGLPDVLCHGDLWSSNLMFYRHNPSLLKAIIDPPLAYVGSLMYDIAQLLCICTSPEVRHHLEGYILTLYYDTLKGLMEEEGRKHITFTLEKVRSAYRIRLVNTAINMIRMADTFSKAMKKDGSISEEEREKRVEKLMDRVRAIVGDAVQILEEDAPEWLDE